MIDAVLSYHTNPYTCGVAKWNIRLAKELRVPFEQFGRRPYACPLISIKTAEMASDTWAFDVCWYNTYDLFLHDEPHGLCANSAVAKARRVYAANEAIARYVRTLRQDVIAAWCPSTIEASPARADLTILTFGMAHKLTSPYYEKLRDLLEANGEPYTILLSTGVHEGTPWDEALEGAASSLKAIFGADKVDVLGYLSDGALDREIRSATKCAAFFTPALRANNTTAWAILERGKTLITNLDSDSPRVCCWDINTMTSIHVASFASPDAIPGWPSLLDALKMEAPCAK